MNEYRIQIIQTFEFLGEIQEKKIIYKNIKEKNEHIAIFKAAKSFQSDEVYYLRLFCARFINTKRDLFTSDINRQLDPKLFDHENYQINQHFSVVPYTLNWFEIHKIDSRITKKDKQGKFKNIQRLEWNGIAFYPNTNYDLIRELQC